MNLLVLLFILFWAHPFHLSVCDMEYSERDKTIQVSHRIFIDDLENALSRMSEKKVFMHQTDKEVIRNLLEKYLEKNFSIQLESGSADAKFIGYEIDKDVVWCYQETSKLNPFTSIRIKNTVLYEVFDDQQNIIHLSLSGEVKSLKLNRKKTAGTISFQ